MYGQRGDVMQEQMYFPEGGVGSFLTSNMDEMPDNVIAFGQPRGINSMGEVANRMAQMGRNGDTELAHVNRDEIIIDRNMARDPRIRNAVAEVFSDNDMDMARYTVGNAANSINPYTGQREFFLKKLIKGVKKIVKAVAPIVIPAAMNVLFPGMGAIVGGFVGSGITSLAMGNNLKDSLKAGLVGGAMGGIMQGFRNMSAGTPKDFFSSKGQFRGSENFGVLERNRAAPSKQLKEVGARLGLGESVEDAYQTSGKKSLFGGFDGRPNPASSGAKKYSFETLYNVPEVAKPIVTDNNALAKTDVTKELIYDQGGTYQMVDGQPVKVGEAIVEPKDGIFSLKRSKMTPGEARTYLQQQGLDPATDTFNTQLTNLTDKYDGGYKLGKIAGVAALAAPAFGLMDPIPQKDPEPPFEGETTQSLLAANPSAYYSGVAPSPYRRASLSDIMVPTEGSYRYEDFLMPVQTAASGGEMQNFPRRTGYIGGPGTETSDSIPAMLSDGEFVMNARAVRGAGGGSRERGVRKMYDMMRAFEGGAVA
jgi:hypothetical protein